MIRGAALFGLAVILAPAVRADLIQPAELPPASYAGQQYVDSRGCMFVRAGSAGEVLWVPRVSREGVPACSSPPSGQRVPIAEEDGVQPLPAPAAKTTDASSGTAPAPAAAGGYFVAVGSFAQPENAERAEARLLGLDYGVVRGRVQGASRTLITIFAGPFPTGDTAASALQALRAAGFPDAMLVGP